MVELSLLVINEYLELNCLLILSFVELIGKELRQEVVDEDKEVTEYYPLVRSLAKKGLNTLREFTKT